jgi:exonuclease III
MEVIISFPIHVHIFNIYVKSSTSDFNNLLYKIPKTKKTIILSDLNSINNVDLDRFSSNPESKTKNYIPVAKLINDKGWIDAFRTLHPTKTKYSRFGNVKIKNGITHLTASRIDHILITESLMKKLIDIDIIFGDIFESDHRLVIAEFNSSSIPLQPNKYHKAIRKNINNQPMWNNTSPK